MKYKIIAFLLLFPMFEIIALCCVFATQSIYSIKNINPDNGFSAIFLNYIMHPLSAIQECIDVKNPMIIILPILMLVILIYALTKSTGIASQIDDTNNIYGTANWESISRVTRKNLLGKSKFSICSKKYFQSKFMESIGRGR